MISSNLQKEFDFLKMIEHNIDENVDPCDNFYRHSCSVDKPENETMYSLATKMYQEIIKNFTLENEFEYGNKLEANDSSIIVLEVLLDNNQTNNIQNIADDFFESCIHKNNTNIKYILQTLQKTFKDMKFTNMMYDTNCERSSEQLRKKLEKVWYDKIQERKERYNLSQKKAFIRSNAWMSVNKNLFEKHREYLEEFKTEIETLVKVTPWVKQYDIENYFKQLLNSTNFKLGANYKREFEGFESLNKSLSECRSKYKVKSINILCFIEHSHYFTERPDQLNAYNSPPNIAFLHAMIYVYALSTYPGLLYGGSGSTMAHELGHSFVRSRYDGYFVPHFPSSFTTCVQEQFNKTCSIYKEKECKTVDDQFDENGSDIFGLKLAFDLMKKKYGEKMNEVLKGSRFNLTNAEIFFYAANIFDCSRSQSASRDDDDHHASNARINAATVQVPEFQKTFGCDNNSQMMKSKTKQCVLFGEDAPN